MVTNNGIIATVIGITAHNIKAFQMFSDTQKVPKEKILQIHQKHG